MSKDGFLDRKGIEAMAERYLNREMLGPNGGDLLGHLVKFAMLVKRQVVFEERNWRLSQLETKAPPP